MAKIKTLQKTLRKMLGHGGGPSTQDILKEYNDRMRKKSGGPDRDDLDILKKEMDEPPVDPAPPVDPTTPPDPKDPLADPAGPSGPEIKTDPDIPGDPVSTPAPPEPTPDGGSPLISPDQKELDRIKKEYPVEPHLLPEAEKRGTGRPNIQRHHEGASANLDALNKLDPTEAIEKMETADDIARLFEVNAKNWGYDPSTHAGLMTATSSAGKIKNILGPVFNGKVNGRLDELQIFATRRMLATVSEDAVNLANTIYVGRGQGNRSPDMLLKLDQKLSIVNALQRFLQGETRELGRALSQQRLIAETVRGGNVDAMMDLMEQMGRTPESLINNARSLKNAAGLPNADLTHAAATASQDKWRTRWGAAVDLWKGNILTGPTTHAVNTFGNGILNAYENGVVMSLAGVIGTTRRKLIPGQQDTSQVYLREQIPAFISTVRGAYDGFAAFGRYLATGRGAIGGNKAEYTGRISKTLQTGIMGKGMSSKHADITETLLVPAFRGLGAEDEAAKIVAIRQNLSRLSTRQSIDEGLTGMAQVERSVALMRNPPDAMMKQAIDGARDVTLTARNVEGWIGSVADHAAALAGMHPATGWVAPFIRTPSNLIAKGVDMTLLGIWSPRTKALYHKGGADRDVALAKMTLAAAQTTLLYFAYESGTITGAGPRDHKQRKFLEDTTGWKPFSIKVGDQYYSLARLDPFAISMAPVLASLDAAKFAGEQLTSETFFKGAIFQIADHALDKSWMSGLQNLFAAIGGNEPQQDRLIGNILAGYVPYSSAQATIKKAMDHADGTPRGKISRDPKDDDFHGLYYYTQQRLKQQSGLNAGLGPMNMRPPRLWDGTLKLPEQGSFLWKLSPVARSRAVPMDALSTELWENEVIPQEPPKSITVDGAQVSLLAFDNGRGLIYDEYFKKVGEYREKEMKILMQDNYHLSLPKGPDGERSLNIRRSLAYARSEAQYDFLKNDLRRVARRLEQEDPGTYNHLVSLFGDQRRLMQFIETAERRGKVPERYKGKVKVKGIASDAVPLPQQVESKKYVPGPRF